MGQSLSFVLGIGGLGNNGVAIVKAVFQRLEGPPV